MKAVIIGGGIAGLTLGILLKKKNWTVVISERSTGPVAGGHAFLMSIDGMSILSEFFDEAEKELKKVYVNRFRLRSPHGEELIKIKLDDWYSMKRTDLVGFLSQFFDDKTLIKGRNFSHFIYENNQAVAAVFENGDVEYGDVFIGADGSNSRVREAIHRQVDFTPIEVKELVGMSKRNPNALMDENVHFEKIQSQDKGLAVGYIPTSEKEVVWFMQYDVRLSKGKDLSKPEQLKVFCSEQLHNFPEDIKYIIDQNNFEQTYIWNTRDFDLLPRFHKNNIVIIGDAAHLALPFTSAGTTNAILDAQELVFSLNQFQDLEKAFENFYLKRSDSLKRHLERGRELKKVFLNPDKYSEREFLLPLVSDGTQNNQEKINKRLIISYFTDPICSTCWIIQPNLRKLMLEYEDHIHIKYHMGGLLPSWKEYNKGIIKNPTDAANHWKDVSQLHQTPIDADIWIEDPLDSSYPPSIAFKAAQMQDNDKAISFLRRIKEMVFIEKQNIEKWPVLETAALECGLDSALLRKDINEKANELFVKDLELAKSLDITTFPTLIFTVDGQTQQILKGFQSFEKIESTIKNLLPGIEKENQIHDAEKLFIRFNNMTENEFAFISNNTITESAQIIDALYQQDKLKKVESKIGTIWNYQVKKKF